MSVLNSDTESDTEQNNDLSDAETQLPVIPYQDPPSSPSMPPVADETAITSSPSVLPEEYQVQFVATKKRDQNNKQVGAYGNTNVRRTLKNKAPTNPYDFVAIAKEIIDTTGCPLQRLAAATKVMAGAIAAADIDRKKVMAAKRKATLAANRAAKAAEHEAAVAKVHREMLASGLIT